MKLANVKMTSEVGSDTTIVINDQDVSSVVRRLSSHHEVGMPSVYTLEVVAGEGTIEGDGIVRVLEDKDAATDFIVEFLQSIDSEELERQVLDGLGWGNESATAKTLQVLINIAKGGYD